MSDIGFKAPAGIRYNSEVGVCEPDETIVASKARGNEMCVDTSNDEPLWCVPTQRQEVLAWRDQMVAQVRKEYSMMWKPVRIEPNITWKEPNVFEKVWDGPWYYKFAYLAAPLMVLGSMGGCAHGGPIGASRARLPKNIVAYECPGELPKCVSKTRTLLTRVFRSGQLTASKMCKSGEYYCGGSAEGGGLAYDNEAIRECSSFKEGVKIAVINAVARYFLKKGRKVEPFKWGWQALKVAICKFKPGLEFVNFKKGTIQVVVQLTEKQIKYFLPLVGVTVEAE